MENRYLFYFELKELLFITVALVVVFVVGVIV
jgi:hypothetical protein